MKLLTLGRELEFLPINLALHRTGITNLFAAKNNKTLAETLASKKYSQLAPEVHRCHAHSLHDRLGEFLYRLKLNGDQFYRQFLNKYGDLTYSDFAIAEHLKSTGLYTFLVSDEIVYLGRSHDPFEKRINQGYGHISPKNCYRDGQATNCHLNSLITQHWEQVALYICALKSSDEVDRLEKALIQTLQPDWNIQLKHESTNGG